MERVLERQVELADDRHAQPEVELVPVPGEARRDEAARRGEVVLEPAPAHRRLDRGEEVARVGEVAEGEAVAGLDLDPEAGQAGRLLLHELREEREAAQARVEVEPVLLALVARDRQREIAGAVQDVEVALVERPVQLRPPPRAGSCSRSPSRRSRVPGRRSAAAARARRRTRSGRRARAPRPRRGRGSGSPSGASGRGWAACRCRCRPRARSGRA